MCLLVAVVRGLIINDQNDGTNSATFTRRNNSQAQQRYGRKRHGEPRAGYQHTKHRRPVPKGWLASTKHKNGKEHLRGGDSKRYGNYPEMTVQRRSKLQPCLTHKFLFSVIKVGFGLTTF